MSEPEEKKLRPRRTALELEREYLEKAHEQRRRIMADSAARIEHAKIALERVSANLDDYGRATGKVTIIDTVIGFLEQAIARLADPSLVELDSDDQLPTPP